MQLHTRPPPVEGKTTPARRLNGISSPGDWSSYQLLTHGCPGGHKFASWLNRQRLIPEDQISKAPRGMEAGPRLTPTRPDVYSGHDVAIEVPAPCQAFSHRAMASLTKSEHMGESSVNSAVTSTSLCSVRKAVSSVERQNQDGCGIEPLNMNQVGTTHHQDVSLA